MFLASLASFYVETKLIVSKENLRQASGFYLLPKKYSFCNITFEKRLYMKSLAHIKCILTLKAARSYSNLIQTLIFTSKLTQKQFFLSIYDSIKKINRRKIATKSKGSNQISNLGYLS